MKSRKLTYGLILAAAVVWGIIVRRVVSYTAKEEPAPSFQSGPGRREAAPEYPLLLDYRDPFLEEQAVRKATPSARPAAAPSPEPPPEPPPIRFKGVIQQGRILYAILESGPQSEILRQGESMDDFRVSAITVDSVVLTKGKYAFVLKLQ